MCFCSATFVQSKKVYWVDVKSLSLSRSSNGSSTSALDVSKHLRQLKPLMTEVRVNVMDKCDGAD